MGVEMYLVIMMMMGLGVMMMMITNSISDM